MANSMGIKMGGTPTLEGTATAGDVKNGKTFYNTEADEIRTGTFTAQTKTITSSTSAQTVTPDAGKYLSKVTVNALTMSGTYTYASGSTGGTVDLGATNTYRYVNAGNVYAKGKADGSSLSFSGNTNNFSCTKGAKYLLVWGCGTTHTTQFNTLVGCSGTVVFIPRNIGNAYGAYAIVTATATAIRINDEGEYVTFRAAKLG